MLSNLRAAHQDTQSQMELALAWNCIDVAKRDIFNMESRLSWQVSFFMTASVAASLNGTN
jgi:hypothetical protein